MDREVRVEVFCLARDLFAEPTWFVECLIFAFELDFGDNEAPVLAQEVVDLPGETVVGDGVPDFFNDHTQARFQRLVFRPAGCLPSRVQGRQSVDTRDSRYPACDMAQGN